VSEWICGCGAIVECGERHDCPDDQLYIEESLRGVVVRRYCRDMNYSTIEGPALRSEIAALKKQLAAAREAYGKLSATAKVSSGNSNVVFVGYVELVLLKAALGEGQNRQSGMDPEIDAEVDTAMREHDLNKSFLKHGEGKP